MNGLQFLDSLDTTPRRLLVTIDLAALTLAVVALAGATYFDVAEPEVVLHGVWVCLAIEAFLFGLRVTLVRIVFATVFVVAYAALVDPMGVGVALEIEELAVSDWPLMIVISVIVALMSERVMTSARRYAMLYRAASEQLLTAQEDERRRLAQDLHDSVGQALTGLLLTLDATEKIVWPDDGERSDRGRETLHHAQDLAVAALADTRDVAWRLQPPRLREAGLAGAIRELARRAGRPVELRLDPDAGLPGMLHPDREIGVYRIVQEALGNATRHAVAAPGLDRARAAPRGPVRPGRRRWPRVQPVLGGARGARAGRDARAGHHARHPAGRALGAGQGVHGRAGRAVGAGGGADRAGSHASSRTGDVIAMTDAAPRHPPPPRPDRSASASSTTTASWSTASS